MLDRHDCSIPLEFYDPDSDDLTVNVLPGSAWYDYQREGLAFYVQNAGTFCFKIEVADECNADTADICLTVLDNDPPYLNGFKKKYYVCEGEEICFTVTAFDPEKRQPRGFADSRSGLVNPP